MPDKKPSIAPSLFAPLDPAYLERGQLDAFAGRAGMWRVSIWCLRDGLLTPVFGHTGSNWLAVEILVSRIEWGST